MRRLKTLRLRFRSLFQRADVDYELDDELQFHLDHLISAHVARGVTPKEARRLALIEMGGLTQQREACQNTRGIGAIEAVPRDVRFAIRGLGRTPGFTATIVASLALAIALLTTSFSVVNAYLLRSMPFPAADRLYHVWHAPPGQQEPEGVSALAWSSLTDVVELADSSLFSRYYLTDGGYTQELFGLVVARQSVEGLNVRASAGRTFEPADFAPGPTNVLVSESVWRARFGSPEAALGQTLGVSTTTQGGATVTLRVVGILSPDFRYAREFSRAALDIVAPQQRPTGRAYMVRLREGAEPGVVEARITDAIRRVPGIKLPADWPGVTLESVRDRYVKPVRPVLVSVMVASTLVLLIVTANVAILTLLRALRRQKEVAVRLALGAAKRHLVRALVVEAAVISSAALVAGLTIASWIVRVLGPQIELQLGKPAPGGASAIGLDWVTVALSVAVCVFVALALSLVPLFLRQNALAEDLRRDGRTATDGRFARWTRSALITVEVAGSIALLVGCGLMVRTALTLLNTDLGMNPKGVVRSRIALPLQGYPDDAAFVRFYDRFTASLATEARVTIGMTDWPLFLEPARPLRIELDRTQQASTSAAVTSVNAGYLTTLGIRVLEGRNFSETDRAASEPVALVSETLARRLWPTGSAIGQRLRAKERLNVQIGPWRTVVGVVSDVRQTPADEDRADLYVPFAQVPSRYAPILIRTDSPLSEWLHTLRTTVGAIDPTVLVSPPTSLETEWDKQLAGSRFLASLLTGFAMFAALVTLVGLYGVTAYTVRQREPEVAIRMALGATRRQVVSLFMTQAAWVIAGGCLLGIGGAALLARTLERQLHGVTPFDAATVISAAVLMSAAAILATWWPARRAARQNPSQLLNR
jgi:putative ABC transport system permease protein